MKVRSVGLFSLILLGLLNYFTASPSIEEPTVGTGAPPEYLSIQDLDNITFKDDNNKTKTIKIPIKSISEFNKIYSELDNDEQKKLELSATSEVILSEDSNQAFLLLNYSCGTKLCKTLLIKKDKNKNEITTLPLHKESEIYVKHQFSPNKKTLGLLFISDILEDNSYEYTVYIIDLPSFKKTKTISPLKQSPDMSKLLQN
ncbi:hypothetical protein [Brevibacillus laterosporus]|uniref:hypothetical protein n=1 Tax=Brevibacillus laterosporus TaxID=1465 RepID=UPI000368A32D|nr:hypothetical protein [Brevibacillus laterosporus]ATO51356.1 hypothetical protein BrL25_21010 [Brevibacillus laterosporus DSM 25]AYB38407.1 hypothetical protein D5F52_09135 [Brevibacillus laterosporus]MBG9801175.1 hypothetical protein [Brevibacillus laterosporus]MED2002695.1 hypothetical protein [Brevibacillus laterosporus]MED4765056.1 hypothetical protein [Brevibacillus laterosporus]